MTSEARAMIAPAPGPLDPYPVTFAGLFGWFHPAPGRRGVVLCGAHGFEQMAAYRPWRALAERLAGAGCPTLRFDAPGEGDSADLDAAGVAASVAAIGQAIRFLRETAGVAEIVLVGLRLGATFAALAAEAEPVDRLVLLAPVATGRAYLREMRMRAQTIGRLPDGSAPPPELEGLTVGGFRMDAAFLAELAGLNLARIAKPPAPRVLLLAPDPAALAARLGAIGCAVEAGPFLGLAHLVGDPIFVKVPEGDFERITAFVADGVAPAEAAATVPPPARLAGADWTEEPIRLDSGLFGIRCTPHRPEPGTPTILFVSTGMTVRSGWGRQTTRLARNLAAEGVGSFRLDLGGIGDSAGRADGGRPLFAPDGYADVVRAVDHLAQGGPIVLVGGCSGAYAAFHALCRDPRIDGALLVNLHCFDWDPDQDVDSVIRQTYGSAATYAALLTQGATWRRLFRGQIRVGAIAGVLARRGFDAALRRVRRAWRVQAPGGSVARRVAAIRRRGAEIRLVYSAGDPGLAALRRHLGRSPSRAGRRLGAPVTIVPDADHNLGSAAAQAVLGLAVRDLLRAARRVPAARSRKPDRAVATWHMVAT
ncbi:alpha/beta hydrolase [Methylobacterium sp. J-026]|uniref:alpha/beta hydrolase family protein n=1 Tax=Methylobacterium sp. J-026 TaxID=2836624 RepID=UPI001FBA02C6|nr:alpha/beta hydrolase family protein [Methylobacterium sp. J-026]MCJ2136276.1 alpha/beta hydrolase [Methylobacterium sp. J-026]